MPQVVQNLTLWRGITFDSFLILCFQDVNLTIPANITGWTPFAEVRSIPYGPLQINLNPFISNATGGVVTIPLITDAVTISYVSGKYKWDFTMNDPGGERHGPYVSGSFIIKDKITQGQPPE